MYLSFGINFSMIGFKSSFSFSESLETDDSSFLIKFSMESPSTLTNETFSFLDSIF